MNYSAEDRKRIKAECKELVKGRIGACVGIQFLYYVPFLLLSIIMMITVFSDMYSMMSMTEYYGYGMDSGYMGLQALQLLSGMIGKLSLFSILMIVISGPLEYGLMKFYIGLRRGENPSVTVLFKPFTSGKSLWTGIKMVFCMGFRAWLWILVPYIIFVILIGFVAFIESFALVGILTVLFIIALIPIVVKIATYSAGWFVINDDEDYGVWAATRDASKVFGGHFKDVLVFFLSFIGWILLPTGVSIIANTLGLAMGPVIAVLLQIVVMAVSIIIGGFVSAYEQTSYLALYEFFVKGLRQQEQAFAGAAPQQATTYQPQVETPAAPQQEETVEPSANQDENTEE